MTLPLNEQYAFPYLYRWDRHGRKGQPCAVDVRAKVMNSCLVRFPDGYNMVTSRNALARRKFTEVAQ